MASLFKLLGILNRHLLLVSGGSKVAFMSLVLNTTQVPSGKLFAWVVGNKLNTFLLSLVILLLIEQLPGSLAWEVETGL